MSETIPNQRPYHAQQRINERILEAVGRIQDELLELKACAYTPPPIVCSACKHQILEGELWQEDEIGPFHELVSECAAYDEVPADSEGER